MKTHCLSVCYLWASRYTDTGFLSATWVASTAANPVRVLGHVRARMSSSKQWVCSLFLFLSWLTTACRQPFLSSIGRPLLVVRASPSHPEPSPWHRYACYKQRSKHTRELPLQVDYHTHRCDSPFVRRKPSIENVDGQNTCHISIMIDISWSRANLIHPFPW